MKGNRIWIRMSAHQVQKYIQLAALIDFHHQLFKYHWILSMVRIIYYFLKSLKKLSSICSCIYIELSKYCAELKTVYIFIADKRAEQKRCVYRHMNAWI